MNLSDVTQSVLLNETISPEFTNLVVQSVTPVALVLMAMLFVFYALDDQLTEPLRVLYFGLAWFVLHYALQFMHHLLVLYVGVPVLIDTIADLIFVYYMITIVIFAYLFLQVTLYYISIIRNKAN